MIEETNAKNSKAIIVRRFTGFLIVYLYGFGALFTALPQTIFMLTDSGYIYGLHYDITRPYAVFMSLIGFYLIFPIFLISCFLVKSPVRSFKCEACKMSLVHFAILVVSFFGALSLFFMCLFFDIWGDYFGTERKFSNGYSLLFMILLDIFCIALAFKSTFRKCIFMKKE